MTAHNSINFAITIDRKYLKQAAVTITSVAENNYNKNILFFYVLTRNYINRKPTIFKKLECKYTFLNIKMINVTKYLKPLKKNFKKNNFYLSYISYATMYRLLIFKKNVLNCNKIIYLDSDIIVDCDISHLYLNFNKKKLFGCVAEISGMKNKQSALSHLSEIPEFYKFNKNFIKYPYFNAGFFIANLKLCKKMNCFDQMMHFYNKYPKTRYADQDILNAIIGQKYNRYIEFFDPSFNVFCCEKPQDYQFDIFYPKDLIQSAFLMPKIYHYAGPNKPWVNNLIENHYNVWWKYKNINKFIKFKVRKRKRIIYLLFGFIPIFIKK